MEAKLLNELGRRIRRRRDELGVTAGDLAAQAGVSRRYLTEAEAGRANLSVLKLAHIAQALRLGLGELCDIPLISRFHRRIALIGLRGAGKSTVGRRLALELETPFIELDRSIEENAGLSLAEIFDLHGEPHFRTLERETLELELSRSGECVIAAGGSLVTHAETYERLLRTCFTVWLHAEPEDHWSRVVGQGDTRPMRSRPRAMDELRTRLEAREPLYGKAHLTVETHGRDVITIVRRILDELADR